MGKPDVLVPQGPFTVLVSVGAPLLALYLMVDLLRRRGSLPQLTYRGHTPSQWWHLLFWAAAIGGSFALSLAGPLASDLGSTTTVSVFSEASQAGLEGPIASGGTLEIDRLALPFYEKGAQVSEVAGEYVRTDYEAQRLPVVFLLWAALYTVLVMRWPLLVERIE